MVKTQWGELQDKNVQYHDRTWTLTGTVDVRESGALLAVEANQANDVRGTPGVLYFGVDTPGDSLNPGNLGEHFDRLERTGDTQYLLVKKDGRTYRYELQRLEYS